MSFPESEKYSQSKEPQHITMNPNASSDTLYLDSDVAREQRVQAKVELQENNAVQSEGQEGVFAGMKHQFDSVASGTSISDIGNSVGSIAQEKAGAMKDILVDSAVPAAQGALHTVQGQISAISGGAKGAEDTVSEELNPASREEHEYIDNMSNEQICDFLREKHMSNKHSRPTN